MQFVPTSQTFYEKYRKDGDEEIGVFPKAWQVGRYLRRLCDEVTTAGAELELNTEVVSVETAEDGSKNEEMMKWRVRTRKRTPPHCATLDQDADGGGEDVKEEEHIFDHLILASGFFGTPKIPFKLRPFLSTITPPPALTPTTTAPSEPPTITSPLGIPVIHSSSFRSLTALLSTSPTPPPKSARKILIIGGSMSGAEIASAVASELSSLAHSPGTPEIPDAEQYEVIHIASRPFCTLPRYLPFDAKSAAPTFLPLDFVFLNLVNRPPDTRATNRMSTLTPEAAQKANKYYASLSGQAKPHAWIEMDKETDAPWLAVCDEYTTHALCGNICDFRGRLTSLSRDAETGEVMATISTPLAGDLKLGGVAAVVLATGFSSTNSLSFLSEDIKQKLDFKPDSYMSLQLSWQSTISPVFPTLGFVGMYNGPYWGVMEQQALLLHDLWARFAKGRQTREDAESDLATKLREAGSDGPHLHEIEEQEDGEQRVPQFPMGDYVHVIYDLLSLRGKTIGGVPEGAACWPLIPESFSTSTNSNATSLGSPPLSEARQAVQKVVEEALSGRFFPRNLFRAFLGQWSLQRTITSKSPTYPSGTLTGTATFHPRIPTSSEFSGEYLFTEEGDFRTETGLNMRASRRYVYRLQPGKDGDVDKVSQWFVKVSGPEKNVGVDYLFHELDIIRPDGTALAWSSEAAGGAACPPTKAPTKKMEAAAARSDAEVRGGWSSVPPCSPTSLPTRTKPTPSSNYQAVSGKDEDKKGLWTARGHHLCIDDTYDPEYVFRWKGAELESWTMAYTVKGPGKDYCIHSKFTRPVCE